MNQTSIAADLAGGAGHELRCVAHWYTVTDRAAAEQLDRIKFLKDPDLKTLIQLVMSFSEVVSLPRRARLVIHNGHRGPPSG